MSLSITTPSLTLLLSCFEQKTLLWRQRRRLQLHLSYERNHLIHLTGDLGGEIIERSCLAAAAQGTAVASAVTGKGYTHTHQLSLSSSSSVVVGSVSRESLSQESTS